MKSAFGNSRKFYYGAVALCAVSLGLFLSDNRAVQSAELTPMEYQACAKGQSFPKQCPEVQHIYDDAYVKTLEDLYHDRPLVQVRKLAEGGDLTAQAVVLFRLPKEQSCKKVQTIDSKVAKTPLALYVRGYCLWNGFGFSKDQASGLKMARRAVVMMPSSGMKGFLLREYATFISNTPVAVADPKLKSEMFDAISEVMIQSREKCTTKECRNVNIGEAHNILGEHFQFVEKRFTDAMYHYTKAIEFDEPGAMINVALIYANGNLGFTDHQRALDLLSQARTRAIVLGIDVLAVKARNQRRKLRIFIESRKQLIIQNDDDYWFQRGEWLNHKREQDRIWQCINGQRNC